MLHTVLFASIPAPYPRAQLLTQPNTSDIVKMLYLIQFFMILSDADIKKAMEDGQISVKPLFPNAVQPASIDLHLDRYFLIFDTSYHHVIDIKNPVDDLMREIEINDERPFVLHPGEFALGSTFEEVGVADDMVGRLEGKSSLGRLGIIIHATAGYLDPGNKLHMTLELHNIGTLPVKLYYKMPIAQMSFSPLSSRAEKPYGIKANSKYFGASKPQASAMYRDFIQEKPVVAAAPILSVPQPETSFTPEAKPLVTEMQSGPTPISEILKEKSEAAVRPKTRATLIPPLL